MGNEPVILPVYWDLRFALIGEKSGRIEDPRPFPSCGCRTPYVKVLGPHECRTINYSARPLRICAPDKTNTAAARRIKRDVHYSRDRREF